MDFVCLVAVVAVIVVEFVEAETEAGYVVAVVAIHFGLKPAMVEPKFVVVDYHSKLVC